jgi:uroporphyrin-III C-methyltransferase / precorrin-2 dehydrogenase / sirohydrochlorin ferrochelatase
MDLLPIFVKLDGRRVVVVGTGWVAASKLDALVRAGADIRVIDPDAFVPTDLDDAWYVVTAATAEINGRVAEAAEARHIFVNAVDDPPNASAYLGGVIRRAGVTIAISTGGDAPALAGILREGIDALLPPDLDRWAECAREKRRAWKADGVPMEARRPQLVEALKRLYP